MGKLPHLSIFFFTLAKNSISCFYWLQFLVFCIVLTFFISFSSAVVLTVSAAFLYAVTLLLTGLSSALVLSALAQTSECCIYVWWDLIL